MNYSRQPLPRRLGWAETREKTPVRLEEIRQLCKRLIEETNKCRLELKGPLGERSSLAGLDKAIDEVLDREGQGWLLSVPACRSKAMQLSGLMNYLGITGFFFPFTGETNINYSQPSATLPHTVAHEKCHQSGVGSEDECNFLAFLICIRSKDPYVRYSGYLFAQRQLLFALLKRDKRGIKDLIEMRHPAVQQDVQAIYDHWWGHRGVLRSVSRRVNNSYLKLNKVKGGIDSYNRSARLLILYARHNKGYIAKDKKEPQ